MSSLFVRAAFDLDTADLAVGFRGKQVEAKPVGNVCKARALGVGNFLDDRLAHLLPSKGDASRNLLEARAASLPLLGITRRQDENVRKNPDLGGFGRCAQLMRFVAVGYRRIFMVERQCASYPTSALTSGISRVDRRPRPDFGRRGASQSRQPHQAGMVPSPRFRTVSGGH